MYDDDDEENRREIDCVRAIAALRASPRAVEVEVEGRVPRLLFGEIGKLKNLKELRLMSSYSRSGGTTLNDSGC